MVLVMADMVARRLAFEGCGIASSSVTAFLFDLDGTLLDSVYQHVLSWREALEAHDIRLSVWKIHRKIGMSGGLFTQGLLRETGRPLSPELIAAVQEAHAEAYQRRMDQVRPLPGAQELLDHLSAVQVPWAVATSGRTGSAAAARRFLDIPLDVPVVTRDDVEHAKPDPDLFTEAARRLGVAIEEAVVVGDSVWDLLAARRARALGVGLLSGGYGEDELIRAGAYRVYADPSDLLAHLDEVGARRVGRERDGQR
jgi:HAD superfamily hydrolase (TIGR01509 family)